MSVNDYKQLFDADWGALEERLKRYARELVIDVSRQTTGQLPNRHLAPIQLSNVNLVEGILGLANGGTNADLSNTGPGVPFQASSGADFTVGDMPFSFIDFTGAVSDEQVLVGTGAGTAAFGAVNLASTAPAVTGVLPAAKGGTGVNNATRTLTINTNSGTLGFSSAGLTLTIPATGTAALLGTAQTFTADQTIQANIIISGTGRRITGVFDSATAADRPTFQSSTTNGITVVQAIPNGTATTSGFAAYNAADPDNASRIVLTCTSAAANFNSSFAGTGSTVPLKILIGGTESASFNTDQSVSITKWLEGIEITAPAAGAANSWRMYGEDNGAGKTRVMIKFSSGAAQQIAIQP